ncbi:hypothetical protein [Bacillus litorisediminis]|uniref:hypothetical protein n=1 Tax=Bacillus litorisediminis TaxID=2922713 RepID=UPI001FAD59CB|nr:hypothetical protein [Bacillus litorisediminis]
MKPFNHIFGVLFLTSVILTACGTSSTAPEEEPANTTNPSANENTAQNPEETDAAEEPDADTNEEENSKTLTYTFNGSEVSETASLISSPEQPYSLSVLPGFTLDSEEPGKDVLYLNDDSSIFMRIELIDKTVNIEQLIQTTTDQLAVVTDVVNHDESSENVELPDAIKLEASNNEQTVTSYIKKGDFQWKITMFTTPSSDYRDAFLEMAKTIVPAE